MTRFKFVSKNNISGIPKASGVYCFSAKGGSASGGKDKREILYIGKAVNLKKRVRDHFRKSGFRDHFFIDKVGRIGYIQTSSEIEALILEANLIKRYLPKYNVTWKDGKNYSYINITKEKPPRVLISHEQGSLGPFVDSKALKQVLRFLRRVFPYYTAKKHLAKPCQDCLLGLCPGPNPDLKEYRKSLGNLKKVLQGKRRTLAKTLEKEMIRAADSQNFEKAARIRNQITSLQKIFSHSQTLEPETPRILQNILKSKKPILKIEAYDISNLQGQEATGSMVSFFHGKPDKDFYRRFKIKISGKPNDTAMIREVLERRLKHADWPYPDFILIDGGKAQLNAAIAALKSQLQNPHSSRIREAGNVKSNPKSQITIMALAKKHNELFIEGKKKPLLLKNLARPVFNLILQLRDEAHRFARNYHLKLRRKKLLG